MKWDAEKYNETCGRVTEHGNELVNIIKKFNCGKVLDIGCGTGVLTNEIAKFANEVIGIDASIDMIDKAKILYPKIEFDVMDACSLPWNEYFDVVFSNAVFHFIQSQEKLLDSVHKSLVKNGLLACEFGASGNICDLLGEVEKACKKRGKNYSLRFFYPTKEKYEELLKKTGFLIESVDIYDLDTKLREGEFGLKNWINQIFSIEMEWFDTSEKENVLAEIELALRPTRWDGNNWHLANKRIKVIARKVQKKI